jgi:hypothetical protein
VINALGYKYDKEKESFSVGAGNANGQYSFAEGGSTTASGYSSHAEGIGSETGLTNITWENNSKILTKNNINIDVEIGNILRFYSDNVEYRKVVSKTETEIILDDTLPFSSDDV